MRNIFFLLFISVLFSCNDNKQNIGIIEEKDFSQEQIDSILDDYNFVYSNLTFIDSTTQVILPISTKDNYRNKRNKFSGHRYESYDYPKYWNILFFNSDDNETNLLTDSKVRIQEFVCNIKNSGPILKNSILYEISDSDYNEDNKLNYDDPIHLFISKIDGNGLSRLSPLNERLKSYNIVPDTDKIIFRTVRDTNNDKLFDSEDEEVWYQIDLADENSIKEVIIEAERKKIERLYFDQWLVKHN